MKGRCLKETVTLTFISPDVELSPWGCHVELVSSLAVTLSGVEVRGTKYTRRVRLDETNSRRSYLSMPRLREINLEPILNAEIASSLRFSQ